MTYEAKRINALVEANFLGAVLRAKTYFDIEYVYRCWLMQFPAQKVEFRRMADRALKVLKND